MNQPSDFDYNSALQSSINDPLNSAQQTTGFFAGIAPDLGSFLGIVVIGLVFIFGVFLFWYLAKNFMKRKQK